MELSLFNRYRLIENKCEIIISSSRHLAPEVPCTEHNFFSISLYDVIPDVDTDCRDVITFGVFVFDGVIHTGTPMLIKTNISIK